MWSAGRGTDTFLFVNDGRTDKLQDWKPGELVVLDGLDEDKTGLEIEQLSGKKFKVTIAGDKLILKTKQGGLTECNVFAYIDPSGFYFF